MHTSQAANVIIHKDLRKHPSLSFLSQTRIKCANKVSWKWHDVFALLRLWLQTIDLIITPFKRIAKINTHNVIFIRSKCCACVSIICFRIFRKKIYATYLAVNFATIFVVHSHDQCITLLLRSLSKFIPFSNERKICLFTENVFHKQTDFWFFFSLSLYHFFFYWWLVFLVFRWEKKYG